MDNIASSNVETFERERESLKKRGFYVSPDRCAIFIRITLVARGGVLVRMRRKLRSRVTGV